MSWIPVTAQLPPVGKSVLAVVSWANGGRHYKLIAMWNGQQWNECGPYNSVPPEVTHWQFLEDF